MLLMLGGRGALRPDGVERFSANLRFLCERHSSITAVCQKIGLNRQQFNKYLSGVHLPSPGNIRLISQFFGLGTAVLFADPDEVRMLVDGNYFPVLERLRGSRQFDAFMNAAVLGAKRETPDIAGVYDRYQYSSIYKGAIIRSLLCIYRNENLYQHCYLERFPSAEARGKTDYIFKYHGFTVPLAGRIFFFDFESVQKNELTTSILMPVQRSKTKFMFGIASGIAATMLREPYATRTALHYRRAGLIGRADMAIATTLQPDDPSIPRDVLHYLGDGSDMLRVS